MLFPTVSTDNTGKKTLRRLDAKGKALMRAEAAHYSLDRSQNAQKPKKMMLMKKVFNTWTSTWKWSACRMVVNIAG